MSRPTGVTVLGFLQLAGGISTVLLGLVFLQGPAAVEKWGLPPFVTNMGAAGGTALIVAGVLNLVVGWGLLKLWGWARTVLLVLTALSLAGSAMGILLGGVVHEPLGTDVLRLLVFMIDALIVWYLLRPECKQAFTRPASGPPPTAGEPQV